MKINRYIAFAIAVLSLYAVPQALVSDWHDSTWFVDIRPYDNGIEVVCVKGCNFKNNSAACGESHDHCIIGLSYSSIGGRSGQPFVLDSSVFDR